MLIGEVDIVCQPKPLCCGQQEAGLPLHSPPSGWFIASLVIVLVAVVSALVPIPYASANAAWIAVLGYVVLALGSLAPQ